MRFLLDFKVDSGIVVSFITDANDLSTAKHMAMQLSQYLFKDSSMFIRNDSRLIHSERWGQDRNRQYRPGVKSYASAFILNGEPQFITTDASGTKSAFTNIIMKFGINTDTSMFVYEIGQAVNRRDSVSKARITIKNNKELGELVRCTINKFRRTPEIQGYWTAFNELLVLLKEYKNRQYINVSAEKMIMLVAVMIYLSDTGKYSLESQGCNSLEAAIQMVINLLTDDIKQYKVWLAGGQSEDIIIV
jgi:hypothetical protein